MEDERLVVGHFPYKKKIYLGLEKGNVCYKIATFNHDYSANLFLKHMNKLVKDLEVLEILKRIKWDVYENGGGNEWYWFIDTNKSMRIAEEEANKVKEWLDEI